MCTQRRRYCTIFTLRRFGYNLTVLPYQSPNPDVTYGALITRNRVVSIESGCGDGNWFCGWYGNKCTTFFQCPIITPARSDVSINPVSGTANFNMHGRGTGAVSAALVCTLPNTSSMSHLGGDHVATSLEFTCGFSVQWFDFSDPLGLHTAKGCDCAIHAYISHFSWYDNKLDVNCPCLGPWTSKMPSQDLAVSLGETLSRNN